MPPGSGRLRRPSSGGTPHEFTARTVKHRPRPAWAARRRRHSRTRRAARRPRRMHREQPAAPEYHGRRSGSQHHPGRRPWASWTGRPGGGARCARGSGCARRPWCIGPGGTGGSCRPGGSARQVRRLKRLTDPFLQIPTALLPWGFFPSAPRAFQSARIGPEHLVGRIAINGRVAAHPPLRLIENIQPVIGAKRAVKPNLPQCTHDG